jgi:hypothetical protein
MKRILERFVLSFALGLLAPIAFILGAEPFGANNSTSGGEVAGGCVAVALYLAICQFWLARSDKGGFPANWPIVVGMGAPPLGVLIFMSCVEERGGVSTQGIPMLIAAGVGIFAGATLAMRQAKPRKT